ncbi:MAG: alpha/beta hydrolase family protein [Hyphomicrobiales bacterium]
MRSTPPRAVRSLLATLVISAVMFAHGGALAVAADWNAGFAKLSLRDPIAGGLMTGIVTYPTTAATHSVRLGPNELDVAENAPPAPGSHPLVIFSHGRGGLPESYHDVFTDLARRGFIVAGVAHPGDNYADRSGANGDAELVDRTRHVVALIDYLLGDGPLDRAIDRSRIGVMGHLAGGYAALLLVGARPDFSELGRRCRGNPNRPSGAAPVSHDPARTPVSDPRIRAAVIMAPAWGCLFDRDGLKDVGAPLRIYQGGADELLHPRFTGEYLASELPVPPEFVNFATAGHFVFLAPCPFVMRMLAREICADPSGIDRAALHARMNAEIAEFFARTLAPP